MCARIYDKAAQQKIDGHWIRVELQANKTHADHLATLIAENGEKQVLAILHRYLDFKEPGVGNVTRRPTVKWWSNFLADAPKMNLGAPVSQRSIVRTMNALERQYGPNLALLGLVDRTELELALKLIIDRNIHRLSPRHIGMLPPALQVQVLAQLPKSVKEKVQPRLRHRVDSGGILLPAAPSA